MFFHFPKHLKIIGFIFNIFVIIIQYIIIINSSNNSEIIKNQIGNNTTYNFDNKIDNIFIKMFLHTVDYVYNKIIEDKNKSDSIHLTNIQIPTKDTNTNTNELNNVIHQKSQSLLISHLSPIVRNSRPFDILAFDILYNGWCPLCACKKSESILCTSIMIIMHERIINFDGICVLCPEQQLTDVDTHIQNNAEFLNINANDYPHGVPNLFFINTDQNIKLNCDTIFKESVYKELKPKHLYTEMIGCINNPSSNYPTNYNVKAYFIIRWFWFKYYRDYNSIFISSFFLLNNHENFVCYDPAFYDAAFSYRCSEVSYMLLININGKTFK